MLKNSREIFDRFLVELVPASGLSLAKARPWDFAIYEFAGSAATLALLQVGRAFGVRRFVGHIGVISGESINIETRGRMIIGGLRLTHIFNVEALLASAYIDETDVCGSIKNFLLSIGHEFDRLEDGSFDKDLSPFDEELIVTPVVGPSIKGN